MKNKYIQRIIFFFASICLVACSNNAYEEDSNDIVDITNGIPIITTLNSKALPENLQCTMYIFWKNTSDAENQYALKETKILDKTEPNKLKFMNNELVDKTYRFLFIATPSDEAEIALLKTDGNSLQQGDKWNNVMIESAGIMISADNYQGFVDKTGDEILNGKTINCTLTRLVGQVIFDIYKVLKEEGVTTSQNVELPHFSVLDRVFKIEIEYSNITKSATYSSNSIIHRDVWDNSYKQTIEPKLFENENHWFRNFKVDMAEPIENLTFSEEKLGSAHIKGIYCMPAKENLKIKMTFHYYDTTPLCDGTEHIHSKNCYTYKDAYNNIKFTLPICGKTEHTHLNSCYKDGVLTCTKEVHIHRAECYDVEPTCGMVEYVYTNDCFTQKEIVLNLPKENATPLSIIPNHYTLNTAKIRYDRVIDVGVNFSFEFDTAWENDNN
ncbi:MAG: DUF5031 domain-containing protein [Dysgonomonas sp.]|nr:DUF5031 domain-containing protein [Dysgonomonas sp.]